MKKMIGLCSIALLFLSSVLVGCGGGVDNSTKSTDTKGQKKPDAGKDTDDKDGKKQTTKGATSAETPPK